jgi:acetyl esterase/lipase
MVRGVTKYNYAFVSADYRLAPQVGIKDIFEDVRDCIGFIRTELAEHTGPGVLDTHRLAVSGSSAGGYLSLLAGLYVNPKPKVILCIYPITDPLGNFFTISQLHTLGAARTDPALIAEFLDPQSQVVANSAPGEESNRNKMYNYMLEKANLAALLRTGSGDEFRIARSIFQCGLPPTYIVHPDGDKDVGVDQSDEVAGVMVGLKMEVCYKRVHGLSHFFDLDDQVQLEDMYEFLLKHL